MFSALKKLAKGNDDRCSAPVPMASSLQKKFSKGVHFNMKILIKGDRNVGKSCLLQRLQGGPFIEEYVPTEQIQAAPIHWTYKNSDHIVKVEVWEVVDKGRAKKKPPLGLKLENDSAPSQQEFYETPVLDATFLDVYKNANGVILMMDITKPWTFEYVAKELSRVPADIPVVVLGNHYDMQHHRQVHPHHIDQVIHQAKSTRTAPVRYAESSMRNGFGLRLLHKFLNIPFLRLQKISLLEQLQRNQRDMEEAEKELDDFQKSPEAHYNSFLDRLSTKRRAGVDEPRPALHSPSIVLGAGKPIIPPTVNPLLAQSLNPKGIKAQNYSGTPQEQTSYLNAELMTPKHAVDVENTPPRGNLDDSTSSAANGSGALDEFYAGSLDASFLDDLAPARAEPPDDSEEDTANPMVTVDQDEVDIEYTPRSMITPFKNLKMDENLNESYNMVRTKERVQLDNVVQDVNVSEPTIDQHDDVLETMLSDYPLWAGDTSARRSPEGGEDPDLEKEANAKTDKKHKKKKSKDKGDYSDKSERKKKHKQKKTKSETESKNNPQQGLLIPDDGGTLYGNDGYGYDDYDSI